MWFCVKCNEKIDMYDNNPSEIFYALCDKCHGLELTSSEEAMMQDSFMRSKGLGYSGGCP